MIQLQGCQFVTVPRLVQTVPPVYKTVYDTGKSQLPITMDSCIINIRRQKLWMN